MSATTGAYVLPGCFNYTKGVLKNVRPSGDPITLLTGCCCAACVCLSMHGMEGGVHKSLNDVILDEGGRCSGFTK